MDARQLELANVLVTFFAEVAVSGDVPVTAFEVQSLLGEVELGWFDVEEIDEVFGFLIDEGAVLPSEVLFG